ncbi:hypothetical protein K450DRAFT_262378 [Umbelopsis ramanniana AG]|uniref:KANL3/Tex30 alpha/beta hydrolase-like domain-containing protein n=1 Tax=Umbelopsis ramanniana AG TaxID=1314678 RepID=A0AAD5E4A6_UMBRA|nr:uncharacterized protein K450DRAFT_262378 [Umbelopsis ramanniana AG]KAI8575320.1 hypothetical protein K450DRAFT_262378 [Umbelopsis ramanniana AG]
MTTRLKIPSAEDSTEIDAVITYEGKHTGEGAPAIIISHPYGPLGGSIVNNVVQSLHKYFSSKNYVTASFNFRGAGRSGGRTSWTGMPERQDYIAVMNHLFKSNAYPTISSIIICGYSFGSMIAGSITPPADIPSRYLLISYPLSVMWALTSFHSTFFKEQVMQRMDSANDATSGPMLFIMGDRDQFTGLGALKRWIADKATERTTLAVVPDGDHFWFGMEETLIQIIDSWLHQ